MYELLNVLVDSSTSVSEIFAVVEEISLIGKEKDLDLSDSVKGNVNELLLECDHIRFILDNVEKKIKDEYLS